MNLMDSRLSKCAFAKLLGDDLEYYIRKYEVILGRKNKSTELDVILGILPVTFSAFMDGIRGQYERLSESRLDSIQLC